MATPCSASVAVPVKYMNLTYNRMNPFFKKVHEYLTCLKALVS